MGLDNQYHTMGGADFHIAMTDMLLAGFPVAGNTANMFPALRPDQVAIGMPARSTRATACPRRRRSAGPRLPDQGHELRQLHRPHGTDPDLRGLMTWSINWDRFNGWEF